MGKTYPLIQENQSLRHLNTFGLEAAAKQFLRVQTEEDLSTHKATIQKASCLILGGGSNLILPAKINRLVLYNQIMGIEIKPRAHDTVLIEVGGGMNWHELVLWTLAQGYGGVENMALIPGTVGAAPVQNIGAYGVELKDVFVSLRAFDLQEGSFREFNFEECDFGYRHSYFKQPGVKGRFLITKIQLELSTANHRLNTSYGAISTLLEQAQVDQPTPSDIARAVIEIRRSKLPDWRQLGNAGSFFKNPIVALTQFDEIRQRMPDVKIPAYPAGEEKVKLAAGWLIDQCGWKGKRQGAVGCYEKQSLVIVNHGGASSKDILAFSQAITADVEHKFGIQLEREVNAVFNE